MSNDYGLKNLSNDIKNFTKDPKLKQMLAKDLEVSIKDRIRKQRDVSIWAPLKESTKARKIKSRRNLMLIGNSNKFVKTIKGVVSGNDVQIGSNDIRARVLNEGCDFSKSVNVKAHSRTIKKSGKTYSVRSHTKDMHMVIPPREYLKIGSEEQDIIDAYVKGCFKNSM